MEYAQKVCFVIIAPDCRKIITENFPKLVKHINSCFQKTACELHAERLQRKVYLDSLQSNYLKQRPKGKPSKQPEK